MLIGIEQGSSCAMKHRDVREWPSRQLRFFVCLCLASEARMNFPFRGSTFKTIFVGRASARRGDNYCEDVTRFH